MDAVKFMKEYKRLCDEYSACVGCPLGKFGNCTEADPEEMVKIVEEWSKEHPKKTNGQVMFDYIQKHVNDTGGGFTSLTMSPRIILEFDQGWWCKEYKE
jgi:hypothetical protein